MPATYGTETYGGSTYGAGSDTPPPVPPWQGVSTGSAWLMQRLFTRPAVIHLRVEGPPDSDGVATITETMVSTRCYAEQAAASEGSDPVWTIEDYRIVLAAVEGLALDGWDRVDVGSVPYEVTGGPWPVHTPHADIVHHVELRARRAEAHSDEP